MVFFGRKSCYHSNTHDNMILECDKAVIHKAIVDNFDFLTKSSLMMFFGSSLRATQQIIGDKTRGYFDE